LAGVGEKVAALTERGMRRKIDFAKSLRLRVSCLKGLSVRCLARVAKRLRLGKGSKELIRALHKRGLKVALVSGGFTYFTERMKKQLGFDYAFGNELEVKNGKLTGRVKGRIIDARRKAEILEEVCHQEGVTPEEAIAVGDGSNDRIMVANAGLGIAFNAEEVLKEVADGTISKGRIKGILYCLGPSETSDKFQM
jgi:phosphoserine phosphatase